MSKGGGDKRDMLPTLVRWFEDSELATQDARTKAERDRDYYDGKQLTSAEMKALEDRKQPAIVINRVRRKIDYLQGLEKQSRQDPKAYPRTPGDDASADAATDGIRYVVDQERFPQTASKVWENLLIEGAGAVDVCAEEGGPTGYRIRIKRVPWDRMFWDPHSSEVDFSDAKYVGLVMWMDEEDVLARWPDAEDAIEGSYAAQTHSDTYDDRPKFGVWGDSTRKRVRVCQVYWNGPNGWMYAAYTKGGYLDEEQPSPYVDEDKEPVCPLIGVSGYVDRDNARYGVVRDMIDPQDEINKRRSKALHLLSVRQVVAEQGAVQNVDEARKEIAKPDGYLEVAPGMRFDIQQTNDLAAGQAQLLQEAKLELDGMGPNASMQGKGGADASGRAIALSQQGGLIEVGMLLDAYRDWKRRVYEAVWQRIRQFWNAETWVRVTDDEETVRFVGLNVQRTLADKLSDMPPEEAQAIAAQMGLVEGDPRLMQLLPVENDVARITVDIVVDEAPDVITLQSEQQQVIGDIMRAAPALAPALIEPFLRSTNLRNKGKIIERVNQMMQQPPPGEEGAPAPEPGAELAATQMEMQAKAAEAQLKAQAEQEKLAAQMQIEQMKLAAQQQADEAQIAAEDRRKAADLEMQWQIAQLNAALKQGEQQAAQTLDRERMAAEDRRAEAARVPPEPAKPDLGPQLAATLQEMMQRFAMLEEHITAPREIVRGADGKAMGVRVGSRVREIARGADGRAAGLI